VDNQLSKPQRPSARQEAPFQIDPSKSAREESEAQAARQFADSREQMSLAFEPLARLDSRILALSTLQNIEDRLILPLGALATTQVYEAARRHLPPEWSRASALAVPALILAGHFATGRLLHQAQAQRPGQDQLARATAEAARQSALEAARQLIALHDASQDRGQSESQAVTDACNFLAVECPPGGSLAHR